MNIQPSSNLIKNSKYNPSFTRWYRNVKTPDDSPNYSNYTYFFRNDLDWKDLAIFLEERFKNQPKTEIYNIGCSDGSEAYSLAISLIENTKNPTKFFPIHASDFDSVAISKAKNSTYDITMDETYAFYHFTQNKIENYMNHKENTYWEIKPQLKPLVEFEVEDVVSVLNNIKSKNCVILCRNFLHYLKRDKKEEVIKKLNELAQDKTVIVVGGYDDISENIQDVFNRDCGLKNLNYMSNWRYSLANVYGRK